MNHLVLQFLLHSLFLRHSDYRPFGKGNGYKDELEVFSDRNYMPLCGTDGESGTCHDAIDKHLIHVVYNPLTKSYHLVCAPAAPQHFHKLDGKLTPPPDWNPYRRLLAWRSIKCGTDYGFELNLESFKTLNQLSENSNSVGDADTNNGEHNASTSTFFEGDNEGKITSIRLENK